LTVALQLHLMVPWISRLTDEKHERQTEAWLFRRVALIIDNSSPGRRQWQGAAWRRRHRSCLRCRQTHSHTHRPCLIFWGLWTFHHPMPAYFLWWIVACPWNARWPTIDPKQCSWTLDMILAPM